MSPVANNNVLPFDKTKPPSILKVDPFTDVEAKFANKIVSNQKEFVDSIIGFYSVQLVNKLAIHGFGIYDDQFVKDFSSTIEVLRATLHRNLGLEYPITEELDDIIEKYGQKEYVYEDEENIED